MTVNAYDRLYAVRKPVGVFLITPGIEMSPMR